MSTVASINTQERAEPTLSVIVAAYNIEDYIEECVRSILASDSVDYEIIAIDDGSSDATPHILQSLASQHPMLQALSRDNHGPSAARNAGIELARGQYLIFVDGDDWVEPGYIDTALDHIKQDPKADLWVFDYTDVSQTERTRQPCRPNFWESRNAAWNKIYRRELIGNDRFDEGMLYEDLAAVRPWVARARHPRHINRALYNYRNTRSGSIMNSKDTRRFFELLTAASLCVERIERYLERHDTGGLEQQLGPDWKRRFYTVDVFVPAIIYWSRKIDDRAARHDYIARFMEKLPSGTPSAQWLARDFGAKIALASRLYKRRHYRAAEFLLFDLGRLKREVTNRIGRAKD
ncbi:glycosyltransferase [Salinisphaera sp. SPP-AMP-43]|uniref:glycosyltransferase family 2 protein n=1 Tax=Salinisphaera sp. SPP-AMP-43 TaxID=3121288 RepID=UPI003C6E74E4